MSSSDDRNPEPTPTHQWPQRSNLVIVSEQGRRTDESRRIIRAQAARASAAQSRVTRARNRGEREVSAREPLPFSSDADPTARESVQSPPTSSHEQGVLPSSSAEMVQFAGVAGPMPLASWLPSVLGSAVGAVAVRVSGLSAVLPPSALGSSIPFGQGGADVPQGRSSGESMYAQEKTGKLHLPFALPRGFAALQQRIPIDDMMVGLMSRTACIDFASPGVDQRLHQLLFDLIVSAAGLGFSAQTGHPIQGHLRVACTCLTIFQGQRATGAIFAQDNKYQIGLSAAWSEAVLLDPQALAEPKSAEASLWAVFIISVTTGATANFFHHALYRLLRDLQLRYWEQVRKVLLDFIYPVSFLDEPCKHFYNNLRDLRVATV